MANISTRDDRVRAIFDREIAEAETNYDTTAHIEWLARLRDEVLGELRG